MTENYYAPDIIHFNDINTFLQGDKEQLIINDLPNTFNGFLFSDFKNVDNTNPFLSDRGVIKKVNGLCTCDITFTLKYMNATNVVGFVTGHQDGVTLGIVTSDPSHDEIPIQITCSNNTSDTTDTVIKRDHITKKSPIEHITGSHMLSKCANYYDMYTFESPCLSPRNEHDLTKYTPCVVTTYFYKQDWLPTQTEIFPKNIRTLATTISSAVEAKNTAFVVYQQLSYPFDHVNTTILQRHTQPRTYPPDCDTESQLKFDNTSTFSHMMDIISRCDTSFNAASLGQFKLRPKYNLVSVNEFSKVCELFSKDVEIGNYIIKRKYPIDSNVYVIGDLHSSLSSLYEILKDVNVVDDNWELYPGNYLIFLGDIVDRGPYGIEILFIAFKLWAKNRNNVVILKGNHELKWSYENYGFGMELKHKVGSPADSRDYFLQTPVYIDHPVHHLFKILPSCLFLKLHDKYQSSPKKYVQINHGGVYYDYDTHFGHAIASPPDHPLHTAQSTLLPSTTQQIAPTKGGSKLTSLYTKYKRDYMMLLNTANIF